MMLPLSHWFLWKSGKIIVKHPVDSLMPRAVQLMSNTLKVKASTLNVLKCKKNCTSCYIHVLSVSQNFEFYTDYRCLCGNCNCMPTRSECVCCRELMQTRNMSDEESAGCIINHPGFEAVCLNPHVLRASYNAYRLHHGALPDDENR